jgi:hypothetical protein
MSIAKYTQLEQIKKLCSGFELGLQVQQINYKAQTDGSRQQVQQGANQ